MKRYEYRLVGPTELADMRASDGGVIGTWDMLNELGDDGWLLIAMAVEPYEHWVLGREIENDDDD